MLAEGRRHGSGQQAASRVQVGTSNPAQCPWVWCRGSPALDEGSPGVDYIEGEGKDGYNFDK